MHHASPLLWSNCPDLGEPRRGKVRDIYDLKTHLLLVATDRLSAFDVVLPDGIPGKGEMLTQLSSFWLQQAEKWGIAHHLVSTDIQDFPASCQPYRALLHNRSMLVKKAKPFPVECIVRGYLAGSAWTEYQQRGSVCGIALPSGLRAFDCLPDPIFTPSTKADLGAHDQNISFAQMQSQVGAELAQVLRAYSLMLYAHASAWAESRGILIADTKMEWGQDIQTGALLLIDELLTPDASRFWEISSWRPGQSTPGLDKQFVRDYLLSLPWRGDSPPPRLPDSVIAQTHEKYRQVWRQLTQPFPGR